MLKLLKGAWSAPHKKTPFPPVRRLITDLMYEAKRKHNIYEMFQADITDFMAWRASAGDAGCSITTYVLTCFAHAVQKQPDMQAYRSAFGGSLITFDAVDVSYTVEKSIEGQPVAWAYMIRDAGRKPLMDVEAALQRAKTAPLEGSAGWARAIRLARLPRLIRRLFWLGPRYSPFLMKRHLGSVGVTSVGMFSKGGLSLLPLSPLTLTLSIGAIEQKLEQRDGEIIERQVISLCLIADHDIIDGAPLARFAEALRGKISAPDVLIGGESVSQR
jgi:pyruvate/2-oxoglutarate dehydrogenase complex dihydrolipoamide acyltransferase (E2) component